MRHVCDIEPSELKPGKWNAFCPTCGNITWSGFDSEVEAVEAASAHRDEAVASEHEWHDDRLANPDCPLCRREVAT